MRSSDGTWKNNAEKLVSFGEVRVGVSWFSSTCQATIAASDRQLFPGAFGVEPLPEKAGTFARVALRLLLPQNGLLLEGLERGGLQLTPQRLGLDPARPIRVELAAGVDGGPPSRAAKETILLPPPGSAPAGTPRPASPAAAAPIAGGGAAAAPAAAPAASAGVCYILLPGQSEASPCHPDRQGYRSNRQK